MAKKEKAEKAKAAEVTKVIRVTDLAEEFGLKPAEVRRVFRAAGFRAPEVKDSEGKFGPRARYKWTEGSEELKKAREYLQAYVNPDEEEEGDE